MQRATARRAHARWTSERLTVPTCRTQCLQSVTDCTLTEHRSSNALALILARRPAHQLGAVIRAEGVVDACLGSHRPLVRVEGRVLGRLEGG